MTGAFAGHTSTAESGMAVTMTVTFEPRLPAMTTGCETGPAVKVTKKLFRAPLGTGDTTPADALTEKLDPSA